MEHALDRRRIPDRRRGRLPDLCDVAERVLQCQTRFGLPVGIQDWPESMDDPEWSVAAGLAMYSAKLQDAGAAGCRGILGKYCMMGGNHGAH